MWDFFKLFKKETAANIIVENKCEAFKVIFSTPFPGIHYITETETQIFQENNQA